MEISLKEARRIERRIQEKSNQSLHSMRATISIYSNASTQDILTAQEKATLDTNNEIALIQARAYIRREIQIANEREGINATIAERDENIRILQTWRDITAMSDNIEPAEIVIRKLQVALAAVEAGKSGMYVRNSDNIEFYAISEDFAAKAKASAHEAQKLIDKNDDTLAGLNALVKIKIPADVVELLKLNNII